MASRAMNIGDARKLSDRSLVNGLVRDPTSAGRYRQVLLERMQKEKFPYVDPYFWILDGEDPRPLKKRKKKEEKKLDSLRDFILAGDNEDLDSELADYLARYPFFDDVYDALNEPARCKQFCKDKGRRSRDNIYGKAVVDLLPKQLKMLLAIRSHAQNWVEQERIERRRREER